MSQPPIDLTNLHEMTGGDEALEKELYQVFIEEGETNLSGLKNTINGDNGAWRQFAHAFKGISRNLGAALLGDLCYEAQQKETADSVEKARLAAAIDAEFTAVKAFLAPFL